MHPAFRSFPFVVPHSCSSVHCDVCYVEEVEPSQAEEAQESDVEEDDEEEEGGMPAPARTKVVGKPGTVLGQPAMVPKSTKGIACK